MIPMSHDEAEHRQSDRAAYSNYDTNANFGLLMYATDGEDTTSNKLSGIEATKSTYLI
jgi:hypothetical protein